MNSENLSETAPTLSDMVGMAFQIGWFEVTFLKKDGSKRTLIGTTNMNLIPEEFHPKSEKKNPEKKDNTFEVNADRLYSVFSREDKGWRSFRFSQLILQMEERKFNND